MNANGCVRARIIYHFSSIIFAQRPFSEFCDSRNESRLILKGVISSFRRIQNFEKRFIGSDFTVWNVKKILENFQNMNRNVYIENSIQIGKN